MRTTLPTPAISVMLAVAVSLSAGPAGATTIFVPGHQPTIQAGIDAAAPGDTVLANPGVYFENLDFTGKDITVASQFLPTGNPALISQTVIDGSGVGSVVRFENGESAAAMLVGFTITNGDASPGYGGGINCAQASPSLLDLVVTGNTAVGGAGIHCSNFASPLIERVTISGNATSVSGSGGGIRASGNCNPVLRDVIIRDNTAPAGGGAYFYSNCSPLLQNVSITDNIATTPIPSHRSGGGLWLGGGSHARLERVTIASNRAGRGGGVFCSGGSRPILIHVTITGNTSTAGIGGGIHCLADTSPTIVNSILWDNSPEEIYFDGSFAPNTMTVSHSDVAGGEGSIVLNGNAIVSWLEGNIDSDPLFAFPADGDFSLTLGSPCIDAGTDFFVSSVGDTLVNAGPGDFNGAAPDMGALENTAATSSPGRAPAGHGLSLRPGFPNPFVSTTTISYSMPQAGFVSLDVYNVLGQRVRSLQRGWQDGGVHRAVLAGQGLAPGAYFVRLTAAGDDGKRRTATGKVVRTK